MDNLRLRVKFEKSIITTCNQLELDQDKLQKYFPSSSSIQSGDGRAEIARRLECGEFSRFIIKCLRLLGRSARHSIKILNPNMAKRQAAAFAHASKRHCLHDYETKTQSYLFFSTVDYGRHAGFRSANARRHARRLFRV
jgi:hypothetical protein